MTSAGVIGIDLGATNCRAGFFVGNEPPSLREEIPSVGQFPVEEGVSRLVDLVDSIRRQEGVGSVEALGIGSPGPIDPTRSVIREAPNMPAWHDVPLRDLLQDRLGLPVFLENDANLAVLGECRRGAGVGAESVLGLTLGTGVGGGFVQGGRLWTGANGMALEVGHIYVGGEGIRCACGALDCLELYCSAEGIKRWYTRRTGNTDPSSHRIFEAARKGEKAALEVVQGASLLLGRAIASLQKTLDPERILVSGGLSREWDLLVGPAAEEAKRGLFRGVAEHFDLRPAALGTDAGLYGAAELALSSVS